MVCALCKEKEANKKNTHYLTDGIIRSCLNQDGSGEREKGFYFNLSNDLPSVESLFQRETSIDKLEKSLGREPTDEEIKKSKQIPFSVDYVFCSECEGIFTSIESSFIKNILPKFRDTDLTDMPDIKIIKYKEIRLFFYLQLWRTHICKRTFNLPEHIAENLRQIILNYSTVENVELNKFPLSITYLQTLGGVAEYTSNFVVVTNDKNPFLIFFNDFIIQFYESIEFKEIHGLNQQDNFQDFINQNEEEFKVNIFQNDERKQFLNDFIRELAKQKVDFYANGFKDLWFALFGIMPPIVTVQEYRSILAEGDFHVLKYSKEKIMELTLKFIKNKTTKLNKGYT